MIALIAACVSIIIGVLALVVQIGTAGIYIGKLEGFKELVNYRFNQQDERLDKHNNFITRVYELEKSKELMKKKSKLQIIE